MVLKMPHISTTFQSNLHVHGECMFLVRLSCVCNRSTSTTLIRTTMLFPSQTLFYLLHPYLVHCHFDEVFKLV